VLRKCLGIEICGTHIKTDRQTDGQTIKFGKGTLSKLEGTDTKRRRHEISALKRRKERARKGRRRRRKRRRRRRRRRRTRKGMEEGRHQQQQ